MYQMPKRPRTHNDHNNRQHKKQKLQNILEQGKRLRNTLEQYKKQKLWFEERMPDATKEFLKISVPMSPEEAKLLEILEIRALLEGPRTIKQQEMLDTMIKKHDFDVLTGLLDRNEEYVHVPVPPNPHIRF
jgi:hypothetical protein